MLRRNRTNQGFTLIELMVSVAIIGILASMATVGYTRFQWRSQRAEANANLKGLAVAQNSLYAEAMAYANAGNVPFPGMVGPVKRQWDAAARAAFAATGWAPEGAVYFDYEVSIPGGANANPCPMCLDCFTISAYGDIDGDGLVSVVQYVKPDTTTGATCPAGLTGHGAPVDPVSGAVILDAPYLNFAADDF